MMIFDNTIFDGFFDVLKISYVTDTMDLLVCLISFLKSTK